MLIQIYTQKLGRPYLLQLIKFWPSCAPGKGSAAGRKFFGSALLQLARSVCLSLSVFFIAAVTSNNVIIQFNISSARAYKKQSNPTYRLFFIDFFFKQFFLIISSLKQMFCLQSCSCFKRLATEIDCASAFV